ncbi:hypothetical protein BCD67_09695 [Oscillatoriales cyanobacterium USR001]|nr:hypothetical protein BCD67_09695 [Oscillatoriales cyanobacterium USR001]
MPKTCFLRINFGNFDKGFDITLRIRGESEPLGDPEDTLVVTNGRLSKCPELLQKYQDWQKKFTGLEANYRGIKFKRISGLNLDQYRQECREAHTDLVLSFREWLKSSQFRNVEDELRTHLQAEDEIEFLIQTDSDELRKMPWDTWEFIRRYRKAAIGITPLGYKRIPQYKVGEKLRILAILGSTKGVLNLTEDRKVLESFSGAEVCFITEPKREELAKLWEEKWDVLFFAGHSSSQPGERDYIDINKYDRLPIIELENTLTEAVEKGLKLAIFNSCDGLGLAKRLENFHIPQVIVWREPVPDMVAHTFLKAFMQEFSQGISLYMSVRRARAKLKETSDGEKMFPGVSFLPVIIQNPLIEPLSWPVDAPLEPITNLPTLQPDEDEKQVPKPQDRKKLFMFGGSAIAAIFLLLIVQICLIKLEEPKKQYDEAEKKLNKAGNLVNRGLSMEAGQKLNDVQRAWKTYRDDQCPFESSITGNKLQLNVRKFSCLTRITEERTKEFNSYVQKQKIPAGGTNYKIAEDRQKQVYDRLVTKSTAYEQKRENAQESWMKFRDVACEFEGKFVKNGDEKSCRIRETVQRSKELENSLK